ncbi:thiol-disulfide oxidoreductase DCC family protein [Erythrobacter rubeus]|uniref:DUF393 domain-containing protein n=1 Tax=Erythrobacter rubeus TaxID=2760803 RepID=A0ABR8KSI6_9SPHN|nr:DUF393 domain-containing protein [Erythrobacter rubeus]MBD2841212.1 DUF393 domain-containing protein [Erythrobacter rubeus]
MSGDTAQRSDNSAVTVWFDGACPLCQREIAFMRKLDRADAIHFIDVSDKADPGCPIDQETLLERFHAREGEKIVNGAAAFAAMWRAIPAMRPLGLIARNPMVLRVLERLYVWHLRIRPQLQRLARRLG